MFTKIKNHAVKYQWFLIIQLVVVTAVGCSTQQPTASSESTVTILPEINFPGAINNSAGLNKGYATTAIDRVTVSVFGFRESGEVQEEFPIITAKELAIDRNTNLAKGEITVPLGNGSEVIKIVENQEVKGENLRVEIEMSEQGQVLLSGSSIPFFAFPGGVVRPVIDLTSVITDTSGNRLGTVTASPNPVVSFAVFDINVQIDPVFVNQVTSVTIHFLIVGGSTFNLRNLGGGAFEFTNINANRLGRTNLEFIVKDNSNQEIGRGFSSIEIIVDPVKTGLGTNIAISGDFDVAIGAFRVAQITWTNGVLATDVRVEDLNNNEVLWEIDLAQNPIDPNISYGVIPSGATQLTPANNQTPISPVNGTRYRITLKGLRNEQKVSTRMDFTYNSRGEPASAMLVKSIFQRE